MPVFRCVTFNLHSSSMFDISPGVGFWLNEQAFQYCHHPGTTDSSYYGVSSSHEYLQCWWGTQAYTVCVGKFTM